MTNISGSHLPSAVHQQHNLTTSIWCGWTTASLLCAGCVICCLSHAVCWYFQVGEGKGQVDEVVEHFNICAGNPAVCMTQVCRLHALHTSLDICKYAQTSTTPATVSQPTCSDVCGSHHTLVSMQIHLCCLGSCSGSCECMDASKCLSICLSICCTSPLHQLLVEDSAVVWRMLLRTWP